MPPNCTDIYTKIRCNVWKWKARLEITKLTAKRRLSHGVAICDAAVSWTLSLLWKNVNTDRSNVLFVTRTLLTRDASVFTYITNHWPQSLVSAKIPCSIMWQMQKQRWDSIYHIPCKLTGDWPERLRGEQSACWDRRSVWLCTFSSGAEWEGSFCLGHSRPLQFYFLNLSRLLCPWDSPGKNPGVGCYFLLQIFPIQGLNPGLLHCRHVLYLLSHQGSPFLI